MSDELRPAVNVFAGRLGGNQDFILNRTDPENASLLKEIPDAAPLIPYQQLFGLKGLLRIALWKQGVIEGVGTFILVYLTAYLAMSPANAPLPSPTPSLGILGTSTFVGAIIGTIQAIMILTLAIYCFGPITGGHLNPFITIATFLVRLTSLPRALIYVTFQLTGASLAGLMLRASWGGRDFKVGGCFLINDFPPGSTAPASEKVGLGNAFAVEFTGSFILIIIVFGVAMDPRNKSLLGPTLAPFLAGLTLGLVSLSLSVAKVAYGGPSMNPARCFGVFVGTGFSGTSWHWIHWVGPVAAAVLHAMMYNLVPPWQFRGEVEEVVSQPGKTGMMPAHSPSVGGSGDPDAVRTQHQLRDGRSCFIPLSNSMTLRARKMFSDNA
ncbi:hypothetical protein PV08_02241 [Exophiala spinifera]|uniref:Aquaporin n=1 Tax=Exophiala spinifera TaxID=91928 RepID=A0A0D1Z1X3_9EURO|nr:uncharacterized protein PV08_02241 [Exophiala spinifera]KIW21661.1 hypothetical protein PV08_02241 [Exophiala spinifera]